MSKQDFENFLKKNAEKKEEIQIDWDKQKQDWLNYINLFYKQIEEWLKPYIDQELVSVSYTEKYLTEDYIGSYSVNIMDLSFANQRIFFEPIGTLLIGTKGRIDMKSPRGTISFILADKDSTGVKLVFHTSTTGEKKKKEIQWTWKILERNGSGIKYIELNEKNFFDKIMASIHG